MANYPTTPSIALETAAMRLTELYDLAATRQLTAEEQRFMRQIEALVIMTQQTALNQACAYKTMSANSSSKVEEKKAPTSPLVSRVTKFPDMSQRTALNQAVVDSTMLVAHKEQFPKADEEKMSTSPLVASHITTASSNKPKWHFDPTAPAFDFEKGLMAAEEWTTQLVQSDSTGKKTNVDSWVRPCIADLQSSAWKASMQRPRNISANESASCSSYRVANDTEKKQHVHDETVEEKEHHPHEALPNETSEEKVLPTRPTYKPLTSSVREPIEEPDEKKSTASATTPVSASAVRAVSQRSRGICVSKCAHCFQTIALPSAGSCSMWDEEKSEDANLTITQCGRTFHWACYKKAYDHGRCECGKNFSRHDSIIVPRFLQLSTDLALHSGGKPQNLIYTIRSLREVFYKRMEKREEYIKVCNAIQLTLEKLYTPGYDEEGFSPLHRAIRRQEESEVRLLVQEWADKPTMMLTRDGQHRLQMTPLMLAAQVGNREIIRILTNANADISAHTVDENGHTSTCFDYAYQNGRLDCLPYLYDIAVKRQDGGDWRAMQWIEHMQPQTLKALVQATLKPTLNPDITTALNGQVRYTKRNSSKDPGKIKIEIDHHLLNTLRRTNRADLIDALNEAIFFSQDTTTS
jgi:ankyrin repeat protein